MFRLQAMVRSAEAGDGGAALNKVVAAEPEGTLSRLLYIGADISSVTVDAEPSTVHAIATVRGVLNAALERAVCGSNATQPSDKLITRAQYTFTVHYCQYTLHGMTSRVHCTGGAPRGLSFAWTAPSVSASRS